MQWSIFVIFYEFQHCLGIWPVKTSPFIPNVIILKDLMQPGVAVTLEEIALKPALDCILLLRTSCIMHSVCMQVILVLNLTVICTNWSY